MNASISDIHSYTVFANVDKRDGKIEGHRVVLTESQIGMIEDIVLSGDKVSLIEDPMYEVIDGEDRDEVQEVS